MKHNKINHPTERIDGETRSNFFNQRDGFWIPVSAHLKPWEYNFRNKPGRGQVAGAAAWPPVESEGQAPQREPLRWRKMVGSVRK